MKITASTVSEEEFFRVVDWSASAGGLGWDVVADRRDGLYSLRVNLDHNDPRLAQFMKQVDGHPSWTVQVDPGE